MTYVDGFVLAVKKKNLPAYFKLAKKACKLWKEYGAVSYCECAGDDLAVKMGVPFTKLAKTKPDETVVFSFIVYKSKAQRNKVNARIMKDPRIAEMCDPKKMPFDVKKMAYGGFKTMVEF